MSADEGGGAGSVPTTNGELNTATPDSPALATPGKRKRVTSHEDNNNPASQAQERVKLQETLHNLVDILSKSDTELQLLSCPLSTSPSKPRSKRVKVASDKEEGTSIHSRVGADRYNSLSEFLSDIERASAAVIERSKAQNNGDPTDTSTSALSETVNRIAAFKKVLNSLVRQAQTSQTSVKEEASEEDTEAPAKPMATNAEVRNDGVVLTLFGNPANPKQLYSSLQKSVKVPLPSDDPETQKFVEVQAPLPEVGLPNGITTTKLGPIDLDGRSKDSKRTFGDVFAPRSTLPQLDPPRKAKSSSRTNWIDPFEAITNYKNFRGDRNNYCLAPLPSGDWLQYGSQKNRRQKQTPQHVEDRSHGDPALWTDDDASMLQSVYSSFAPSFDSSGAVLQEDAKDLVWWSKRGARRLRTLLMAPYQEAFEDRATEAPGNIGELDESTLDEMVKSFNPEDFAENVTYTDAGKEEKEQGETERGLDELLGDISDLLETLSSYQRIRSLQLPAQGGQKTEPKDTAPDLGTTDTPSEAEISVYETLKSSLAAMVSNLPPYAVAKLNGEQLEELNISQKIVLDSPDYNGTMERDDFTIQQERAAAMPQIPGSANRNATPSRHGSYPPGYNNQRAYGANSRVQPQGYYSGRAPGPYTPGQQQPFSGARPPGTPSQRPGFTPGYSQPTPQYNASFQRPGQNFPHPGQQGAAPTQGSPQPYTPRPGQPGPYNAPYGPGRSGSPQKPQGFAAPRTPYMTPGPGNMQQRPPSQHQQHYSNYPSNQAAPQSGQYSNSAAATIYNRSAAEQAALMDRNRAQLAAHHQPRQSSTPMSPGERGGSQEQSGSPKKNSNTPVPS